MKLVTPHLRRWRGTGSRSLFVLYIITSAFQSHSSFPANVNRNIPSRIPLRKRRFRLRRTKRQIRLFENRHLVSQSLPPVPLFKSQTQNSDFKNSNGIPTSLFHPHRHFHRRIICKPSSRADKRNRKRLWYPSLAKYMPKSAIEKRG